MDKALRDRDAERRSYERAEAETGGQGHKPRSVRGFQKLKGRRGLQHLISDSQPPACERTDFLPLRTPRLWYFFNSNPRTLAYVYLSSWVGSEDTGRDS